MLYRRLYTNSLKFKRLAFPSQPIPGKPISILSQLYASSASNTAVSAGGTLRIGVLLFFEESVEEDLALCSEEQKTSTRRHRRIDAELLGLKWQVEVFGRTKNADFKVATTKSERAKEHEDGLRRLREKNKAA